MRARHNTRLANLPPLRRQALFDQHNSPARPGLVHSTSAALVRRARQAVRIHLAAGRSNLAAAVDKALAVGREPNSGEAATRRSMVGKGPRRSGLVGVLAGRREVGLLEGPVEL